MYLQFFVTSIKTELISCFLLQVHFCSLQQAQFSHLPGQRRERRRRFRHRPRLVRHQVRGEGRVDEGDFITALHSLH